MNFLLLLEKSRFQTTLSPTLKETVGFFLKMNPWLYKARDEKKINTDQIKLMRRVIKKIFNVNAPIYAPGTDKWNQTYLRKVNQIIDQEYQTADSRGKVLLRTLDQSFIHGSVFYNLKKEIRIKAGLLRGDRGRKPGSGIDVLTLLKTKTLRELYKHFGMDGEDFYETVYKAISASEYLMRYEGEFKQSYVNIPNPSGVSPSRKYYTYSAGRVNPGTVPHPINAIYSGKYGSPLEGSANWISIIKRLKKHVEDCSPNPSYHRWVLRAIKDGNQKVATIADSGAVLDLLKEYDNLKKRRRLTGKEADIMSFSGELAFHYLSEFISKMLESTPLSGDPEKEKQFQNEVRIEDHGSYHVIYPLSKEASCYYGRGTRWCTAASENNQFKNYYGSGELFILVPKNEGRSGRVQAWVSRSGYSSQIMDTHDDNVIRNIDDFYKLFKKFPILKEKYTYKSLPYFMDKEKYVEEIKSYLESR